MDPNDLGITIAIGMLLVVAAKIITLIIVGIELPHLLKVDE